MSDIQAWDRELRISRRKSELADKRARWRQLQATSVTQRAVVVNRPAWSHAGEMMVFDESALAACGLREIAECIREHACRRRRMAM
jgi:hypothetical protein